MNGMKSQKGQALILIAFGIVALIGFTALAIDGGRAFSDRRHAQNAADTAVLAAALSKVNGNTTYKTQGFDRATSNGYTTGVNNRTVEVNLCNESGVTCTGLPNGADTSQYIRVKITSVVPLTFGRVLGRQSVTNIVEAIARVQGSSSSSSNSWAGAGMVATRSDNSDSCFLANGGAIVNMHDAGIFVNCKGVNSVYMNGGAQVNMKNSLGQPITGQTAGCYYNNGGATFDPISCNQPQQTFDANTFASLPKTDTPPTCSGNGTVQGASPSGSPPNVTVNSGTAVFSGGTFGSIIINTAVTFNPGTYCITGSFNVNGNGTISQSSTPGTVKFVLGNNSLTLSKSPNTFTDLEVYTTNGNLTINANGNLNATRFRFFSTGTGNIDANSAQATFTSSNAYIYLAQGYVVWNGNTHITLAAPPNDDKYAGLLVQMPWSNINSTTLNGGSTVNLTGTFLVPHSNVTFNGGSGFVLHGQIIGYTLLTNGNSIQDIYFQASPLIAPPPSNPTIELTK
jgi:Flp pilus assembly protein TadG